MQCTRLTTYMRPFEHGGDAPFHAHREMYTQNTTSGLGGAAAEAAGTSTLARAREERRACVTEAEWSDMQEQLRAASAAAAATAAATVKSHEPPEDFYDNVFDCLIMEDPVFAMDGFTYERRRIEEWLLLHSRLYHPNQNWKCVSNMPNAPHTLPNQVADYRHRACEQGRGAEPFAARPHSAVERGEWFLEIIIFVFQQSAGNNSLDIIFSFLAGASGCHRRLF